MANGLAPGLEADVLALAGEPADPAWLLELEGELLEGVAVTARLRHAAHGLLAGGRAGAAVPYAARAVARNPLEEGNHELLVRCLAAAGDRSAALRQVAVCEDTLRRELGLEPSPALRDAADTSAGAPAGLPVSGRAAVASQLDAGRALVALGSALVHAVRGRDEEGTVILHEAIRLATQAGDREPAVTAHRELGFVEVQAGRRQTAETWLARAEALADTDAQLAAVLGVRGMNASDTADYPAAFRHLQESVERAERGGDARQQAWSLSILARAHLLRDERSQAAFALDRSLELVHQQRWMAFLPWPQALTGELELRAGRLDAAGERFEHAYALACQLGDPCWEGMTARGLGLLRASVGDHAKATAWLEEAHVRCSRVSDRYQWIRAYVLDAMVATALDQHDHGQAGRLADTLAALAARGGMRELVVRAHLHRNRLGDPAGFLRWYQRAWNALDLDWILAAYATPCFVVKGGRLLHHADPAAKARYFGNLLDGNRRQGPHRWDLDDLTEGPLGRDGALVTVCWTCRRPDGSAIWEFPDSYLLAAERGRWWIVEDVVH